MLSDTPGGPAVQGAPVPDDGSYEVQATAVSPTVATPPTGLVVPPAAPPPPPPPLKKDTQLLHQLPDQGEEHGSRAHVCHDSVDGSGASPAAFASVGLEHAGVVIGVAPAPQSPGSLGACSYPSVGLIAAAAFAAGVGCGIHLARSRSN